MVRKNIIWFDADTEELTTLIICRKREQRLNLTWLILYKTRDLARKSNG